MRTKLLLLLALLLAAGQAQAAQTGLWQFNGDLSAASGSALTFRGTAGTKSTFNTTTGFGIPTIDGVDAQVMKFTAYANTDGLQVNANLPANGGGTRVNVYTLVMDILPTIPGNSYYSIIESNLSNNDSDAEYFIWDNDNNAATADRFGGNATLGNYVRGGGSYVAGNWFRLAIVVDCTNRTCKSYINGEFIGALNNGTLGSLVLGTGGVDGARMSLPPGLTNLLMFVNPTNGYAGTGYINSLAAYDTALTGSDIKKLGTPSATGIPAVIPAGPGASTRVLTSVMDEPSQTNPVTAGDVSKIWAVDGQFNVSIFGYYDYNGLDLNLHHPDQHYGDPWAEISTTPTLALTDSFDASMTFHPHFGANTVADQSILVQLTDTATTRTDLSDSFTNVDTDVFLKVRSQNGVATWFFSSDPASPGYGQAILTPPDQITTLTLRLRYEHANRQFRAFMQVNGGSWYENRYLPVAKLRTHGVLRITAESAFGAATYLPFDIGIRSVTIDKGINPIADGTIKREASFGFASGQGAFSAQLFGDFDDFFTVAGTSDYNGTGQWVFNRASTPDQYPGQQIQGRTDPEKGLSIRLDFNMSMPDGGYGQRLFVGNGHDQPPVIVFNNTGATTPSLRQWGIQFGATDVAAPSPQSILNLTGIPINSVTRMSLLQTYNGTTKIQHLYYAINNGPWHEHSAGGIVRPYSGTIIELEERASQGNTLPYTVGFDLYQETQGELPTPVLPNKARHWDLY